MRCNQGAARVQELSSQVYNTCVQEDDNQLGVHHPSTEARQKRWGIGKKTGRQSQRRQ